MSVRRRRASIMLALIGAMAMQLTGVVALAPTRAASILWTLTASPLAATAGVQRVFTLTATNEDPLAALLSSSEIGCVVVTVPATFTVAGAAVTGSSAGGSWHVDAVAGNAVTVHTDSGGDRLALLDWVRFTITATPNSAGSLAWQSRAFRQQDCTGSAALLGVPPVVVVTAPVATPAPTPAPTPTPRPSLPLPSVPLPSVPLPPLPQPSGPSPTPPPTPLPTPGASGSERPSPTPTPAPSDGAAGTPEPTPRASGEPSGGTSEPGGGSSGGGTPGSAGGGGIGAPTEGGSVGNLGPLTPEAELPPSAPRIEFDEGRLALGTIGLDLLGDIGVWSVPAATLGVPGVILIVWVALQAMGALAWIPAVRSLRGED